MCGIAGVFNFGDEKPAEEIVVRSMLEKMRYRGPDHLGSMCSGTLAMGNVRLAIQGLTTSGNQPMYSTDGRFCVVFNGEIYNYPQLRKSLENEGVCFVSDTDTEVLLHLYRREGKDFVKRLEGMYAFALYDFAEKSLLLVRDPTAQKPLYYYQDSSRLIFASELKCMLEALPSVVFDPGAVHCYLSMGYVPEPHCIIQGIRAVEPGYGLEVIHGSGVGSCRLVELPDPDVTECSTDEWIERADPVFQAAIDRHLLSDVPVTVFMSGGVDSSLIATYLAATNRIREVYTGSFADAADHDEYTYVARLASQLCLAVERVVLTRRELSAGLPDFLSTASQPQGDYSGLATWLLARACGQTYKVVLGGDGGDELFGGYPTYRLPVLQNKYFFIPRGAIRFAGQLFGRFVGSDRYMSQAFQLQQLSQAWGRPTAEAHYWLKCFLTDEAALHVLQDGFYQQQKDSPGMGMIRNAFATAKQTGAGTVAALCRVDFATFLASGTIPKLERNTMQHSLEARLPLLDKEVIALGRSMPESLLLGPSGQGKWALRKLLDKRVGRRGLLNPRKQGFSPPLNELLQGELKEWKEDMLRSVNPFITPAAADYLSRLRAMGYDTHRLEWHCCTLIDWWQRNGNL